AGAGRLGRGGRGAAAPADELIRKATAIECFIDFGSNKEMRWEVMYDRGYVVPNELFFVRDHSRTPRVDPGAWRLRVEGTGVAQPQEFAYDEIVQMPSVSVLRFVECAGNGRSFYEAAYGKRAPRGPWRLGAIGASEW